MDSSRIKVFLVSHRLSSLSLGTLFVLALLVFRLNFGSPYNFHMGTNALDTYIVNYAVKNFGVMAWYPLTDWGQPMIKVPTITYPFILILPETVFIRLFEFVSFLLAGIAMYFVSMKFVKNKPAATLSGLFYMTAVETSQMFEGHTALMLSFAVFPLAFIAIYNIVERPNIKSSIILALIFYILFAVGDIGAFYMIVVISLFEFLFVEAKNIFMRSWDFGHVKFIAFSAVLFVVANAAWLYQYLSGNRPQFTTNVTTVVAPFSHVSGQPIYYSLVGFIADNTYTSVTLHNFEYSFIHGYFYLIFLILPVFIFGYVAAKKSRMLVLFAFSAIPAVIISTANLYPGLSSVNEFLYLHFPLFNYIPALFRWNFYTDFVYALILAYIIGDTCKILSDNRITRNWKRNLI